MSRHTLMCQVKDTSTSTVTTPSQCVIQTYTPPVSASCQSNVLPYKVYISCTIVNVYPDVACFLHEDQSITGNMITMTSSKRQLTHGSLPSYTVKCTHTAVLEPNQNYTYKVSFAPKSNSPDHQIPKYDTPVINYSVPYVEKPSVKLSIDRSVSACLKGKTLPTVAKCHVLKVPTVPVVKMYFDEKDIRIKSFDKTKTHKLFNAYTTFEHMLTAENNVRNFTCVVTYKYRGKIHTMTESTHVDLDEPPIFKNENDELNTTLIALGGGTSRLTCAVKKLKTKHKILLTATCYGQDKQVIMTNTSQGHEVHFNVTLNNTYCACVMSDKTYCYSRTANLTIISQEVQTAQQISGDITLTKQAAYLITAGVVGLVVVVALPIGVWMYRQKMCQPSAAKLNNNRRKRNKNTAVLI
ncbi:uncharacterized protein LOC131951294 [Physella acuta]|uniref:uncharacterized protein LOC131951294 n=1 Tax=Physella acuta TaxID=109671 RepID=UPI0027DBCDEF|nr:uncharacterized protein LOC131951294 [Physella acuta]